MKTKLTIILLLAIATPAFARLRETEAQIEARYGKPLKAVNSSLGMIKIYPPQRGSTVAVTFINGVSEAECYGKTDKGDFSASEIQVFLKANSFGKEWKKLEGGSANYDHWTIDELGLRASFEKSSNDPQLIIRTMKSLAYIQDPESTESARQKEIASVWKDVMNHVKDFDALDKTIGKHKDSGWVKAQPIQENYHLILDGGHLRPINGTDVSLERNHDMTLDYERDLVRHTWRIIALDNQNSWRKAFSYGNGIETAYSYESEFLSGHIAKSAKAYRNGKLCGKAEAIQRITTTIPYQVEVQETHYNDKENVVYTGMLLFSLESSRMEITKESRRTGAKTVQIFDDWGMSGRGY